MTRADDYPVEAPGWRAIDDALAQHHRGATPHQFTSNAPYEPGSLSPLPAISVYGAAAPRHWHFVTYGLSELFEKSSARTDMSGFGYELTFRLPRDGGEERPPAWPLRLLQGIGAHVLTGETDLDSGHMLALGGPINPAGSTRLTGLVAIPDPGLGKIGTLHGSLLFLQLVGLTTHELEIMRDWDLERIFGLLAEVTRTGITDPARADWSEDPRTVPVVRRYALRVLI